MSHRGPIPELPPVSAPAPIMAEARANVAARLTARGYPDAAQRVADGLGDGDWAMRHEVNKLRAERGEAVSGLGA